MQLDIASIDLQRVSSLPCVRLEARASLPETKGVYFVAINVQGFKVIYIGKSITAGFKERWMHHSLVSLLKVFEGVGVHVYITYLELNDWSDEDISLMEEILTRKFDPSLNHLNARSPGLLISLQRSRREYRKPRQLIEQECFCSPEKLADIASRIIKPLEHMSHMQLKEIALEIGAFGATIQSKRSLVAFIRRSLGVLYSDRYAEIELPVRQPKPPKPIKTRELNSSYSIDNLPVYSIRILKKIASQLGVMGYSYMTKEELIQAIQALYEELGLSTSA